jgi:transposase InsO family protein
LRTIVEIYHQEDGVPGYSMMRDYLENDKNIKLSELTVHHYMKELGLRSIVRKKKRPYIKDEQHKVFPNLLNQEFDVCEANKIWCTDFTYIPRPDGSMRYNCTILDLYKREVIATLNSNHIDSKLAVDTLEIALKRRKPAKGLILHSDQGTQYTSKEFSMFCENNFVQQSMSKAGCPYDNAVMERFYNTLKNEYLNLHRFKSNTELDQGLYDFVYIKYNYKRPHRYNNGLPPYVARCAA